MRTIKNEKRMFKFGDKYLIGMIHLPSLLEYKCYNDATKAIKHALLDLEALEEGGFDAALIANEYDHPHTETISDAQFSYFLVIANEIRKRAKITIGVEAMLNDWKSTVGIAKSIDAQFCRIDVFADSMISKWCPLRVNPKAITAFWQKVYPSLVTLVDVQQSGLKMEHPRSFKESIVETLKYPVDGLVITKVSKRGDQKDYVSALRETKAYTKNCALVTSGSVTLDNIMERLRYANVAIIGRAIKTKGRVDRAKVLEFSKLVHM